MILDILKDCVNKLNAEKSAQINIVKEKAMREIIVPHNTEIDNKRNLAIQELTADRDNKIRAIQEQFEKDRQTLISMGEQEKNKFLETTIASETALVAIIYDNTISELNEKIEKETNKE